MSYSTRLPRLQTPAMTFSPSVTPIVPLSHSSPVREQQTSPHLRIFSFAVMNPPNFQEFVGSTHFTIKLHCPSLLNISTAPPQASFNSPIPKATHFKIKKKPFPRRSSASNLLTIPVSSFSNSRIKRKSPSKLLFIYLSLCPFLHKGPPWYSGTTRALGSEESPSARVRILFTVRV
ncbi:hypothetical protein E2C01_054638 [Portunus trituberculatus]|uniref:Uncharacterized protein n=1 Tax=Portunus trituberculatus TaxID=210409 RepID=A0A5B7GSJ1_PORTR|nr:hypothetical protein [Portunus trituberculatus]